MTKAGEKNKVYHIQDEEGARRLAAAIVRQTYEDYFTYRPIVEFAHPTTPAQQKRFYTAQRNYMTCKKYINSPLCELSLTMEPKTFKAMLDKEFYDKYCPYYVQSIMQTSSLKSYTEERKKALESAENMRAFYKKWLGLYRPLPNSDEMVDEIIKRCRHEKDLR